MRIIFFHIITAVLLKLYEKFELLYKYAVLYVATFQLYHSTPLKQ